MAKNRKKIESEDRNGDPKVLYLIDPDAKINKQAQLAYNRAFRDALQSGAILRQKLDDVLRDQEIWDDKKEARYNEILRTLNDNEKNLKQGGIKLSEAKELAEEMAVVRAEFRSLIAERTAMDETTLPENKFLKNYGFVDDELRRIDSDGKLINANGDYVDKTGRLIEWQEDGEFIYVDGDGTKLTEDGEYDVEFSPFLDDSGDPVPVPEKEEEEEEAEEVAEKETAPKKRGRPKKETVEDSTE